MIESGSFELQVRTVLAWDSQRQPSANGTVLGAVAARSMFQRSNVTNSSAQVHVEMSTDRTSSKTLYLSHCELLVSSRLLTTRILTKDRMDRMISLAAYTAADSRFLLNYSFTHHFFLF